MENKGVKVAKMGPETKNNSTYYDRDRVLGSFYEISSCITVIGARQERTQRYITP